MYQFEINLQQNRKNIKQQKLFGSIVVKYFSTGLLTKSE